MSENIPYIIAENGYYYVAYKEKVKVPEIVVSSKGIANGLSEEYNDGWDFGPDSYSPTSTSAIPYTQTDGVMEAINYAWTTYNYTWKPTNPDDFPGGPVIFFGSGVFHINAEITVPATLGEGALILIGVSIQSTYLDVASGINGFNLDNMEQDLFIQNMTIRNENNATPTSLLRWQATNNVGQFAFFDNVSFRIFGTGSTTDGALYVSNIGGITMTDGEMNTNNGMGYNINGNVNALLVKGTEIDEASGYVNTVVLILRDCLAFELNMQLYSINYVEATGYFAYTGFVLPTNSIINIFIIKGEYYINSQPISMDSNSSIHNLDISNLIINVEQDGSFVTGDTTYLYGVKNNPSFLFLNGYTYTIPYSTPSTPSVPASGTAQSNSNPYAVKVYVNGGALTKIQITIGSTTYTVYSNSTASAVYEGFTLPAGASITLTYSTAPTWSWLPE